MKRYARNKISDIKPLEVTNTIALIKPNYTEQLRLNPLNLYSQVCTYSDEEEVIPFMLALAYFYCSLRSKRELSASISFYSEEDKDFIEGDFKLVRIIEDLAILRRGSEDYEVYLRDISSFQVSQKNRNEKLEFIVRRYYDSFFLTCNFLELVYLLSSNKERDVHISINDGHVLYAKLLGIKQYSTDDIYIDMKIIKTSRIKIGACEGGMFISPTEYKLGDIAGVFRGPENQNFSLIPNGDPRPRIYKINRNKKTGKENLNA